MAHALDITASDEPLLEALKNDEAKKSLVQRRGFKRQSITKTLSKISNDPPTNAVGTIFYKQKLNKLISECGVLDAQIEEFMLSNSLWSDGEFTRQCKLQKLTRMMFKWL